MNQLVLMTSEEARAAVDAIKSHVQQARALLLDLHEREGWRALGYSSWEECVSDEFGRSRSYMYRQLAAAKLEIGVGSEVGVHPESHMRAISETLDDEDQMQEAYQLAVANGATSAAEYRKAAMAVWVKRNLRSGSMLVNRAVAGIISTQDAYNIGRMMVDNDLSEEERAVLDYCTDERLAEMLINVSVALPEVWEEIVATGSLPGIEQNIPIGEATSRDLKAYLTLDSAERRAQHVERNRDVYQKRNEIIKEVIDRTKELVDTVMGEEFERALSQASALKGVLAKLD